MRGTGSKPILNLAVVASLLLALIGGALVVTPAHAASIVVNTDTEETNSSDGTCSLREAIIDANTDTASGIAGGECAPGSGDDVISFTADYTITLGSRLPDVASNIVIDGRGLGSTIIQASTCNPVTLPGPCTPATYGIFNITAGTLTLNDMTVRYGVATGTDSGAAVNNGGGGLDTYDVIFDSNDAGGDGGAIYNAGVAMVQASTFMDNRSKLGGGGGGAIFSLGTLTVQSSTFEGNTGAGVGGAIAISGGAVSTGITNSTFWANTALSGGGVYLGTTSTVINSSFSGNTATAGANNGGGIFAVGSLNLKNTLLANSGGGFEDCYNFLGDTLTSDVDNLIETNGVSGHKCGTPSVTSDPGTLTYGYNGGITPTIAIEAGSPANNAGDDATCSAYPVSGVDQRGYPRPSVCDIGSFEVHLPPINDAFESAPSIVSLPSTTSAWDIRGATTGPSDPIFPCGGLSAEYKSVWFALPSPSATRSITADTFGSNYDTVLGVWTGSYGSLTNVACNDDTSGHGLQSQVFFQASGSGPYYIEVASYGPFPNGDLTLNVTGFNRTVGDFDANGTTNVAVFRPATDGWFAKNLFGAVFGLPGDIPVPGDYNGDHYADIAVFRPSNASWYIKAQTSGFYGVVGDVPVQRDYDGNETIDWAVYRPSTSAWFIKGQTAAVFGLPGDIPVPADYNGDGKADIAVFRPSTAAWYVRGQFAAVFGLPGDIPIPGDYNGDGIADLAVFRPSTNGWFVKNVLATVYGASGDIPVPGDYDGNGTTDIAVYRPSTSGWFVQGQSATVFGLVGDYPLPAPDTNADGDPYQ